MFGKLALLILVLGGLSAAMLVDRQKRLDLAAEMQRTHARLRQHEQATWRLRADIAYRVRPAEIRAAVERLNVRMVPIPDRLDRSRSAPPPVLAGSPRGAHGPSRPTAPPAGRGVIAPGSGDGAERGYGG